MKSRLEKVLDKMPNKKVDLKAHKVDLGLKQEITSLIDTAYYHAEAMYDMALESNNAYEKIKDALNTYNSLLEDYNIAIESFSFNQKQFLDSYVEIAPIFNRYLDASNELGIDVEPSMQKDMEELDKYFTLSNNSDTTLLKDLKFREIDEFGNFR